MSFFADLLPHSHSGKPSLLEGISCVPERKSLEQLNLAHPSIPNRLRDVGFLITLSQPNTPSNSPSKKTGPVPSLENAHLLFPKHLLLAKSLFTAKLALDSHSTGSSNRSSAGFRLGPSLFRGRSGHSVLPTPILVFRVPVLAVDVVVGVCNDFPCPLP